MGVEPTTERKAARQRF